jgi:ribonuclease-3 family protein
MQRILPLLTDEETALYKRGRNSSHLNVPKSASPSEYRTATGMEVLFGYLHLSGQTERISELFALAYPDDSQP